MDSRGGIAIVAVVAAFSLCTIIALVMHLVSGEKDGARKGMIHRVAKRLPLQSIKIIVVVWQILTQVRDGCDRALFTDSSSYKVVGCDWALFTDSRVVAVVTTSWFQNHQGIIIIVVWQILNQARDATGLYSVANFLTS